MLGITPQHGWQYEQPKPKTQYSDIAKPAPVIQSASQRLC